MKPWLDKAHSTMTAIWFYYSLKKDLFSYILIICGASSAFFKWRTQRINFCSQNDTYTHTRTHFPWCTLSVLSQFISLGPNSYIHANKQALSARPGLKWNHSGGRAEVFVWTCTVLMLMDWYAGWAPSMLQHRIIQAAQLAAQGERGKWGMKKDEAYKVNVSATPSYVLLLELVRCLFRESVVFWCHLNAGLGCVFWKIKKNSFYIIFTSCSNQ